MAIRIEQNLFYVESKGLSLILENRDGYLMLKHLGRPIPSYHFSNTVHERDHAFSGNPTPDNRMGLEIFESRRSRFSTELQR